MRVQLLTASWCGSCQRDLDVWRRICAYHGLNLELVDIESPEGELLTLQHHLKIMPAVLIDDKPRAVGVQTEAEVEALLAAAQQTMQ